MLGAFASFEFAGALSLELQTVAVDEEGNITSPSSSTSKKVALLGDVSNHGGSIISSNQNGTVIVEGKEVAVHGALHFCPITGHGTTTIQAGVASIAYVNGKAVVLDGSTAGCGAKIKASAVKTFAS